MGKGENIFKRKDGRWEARYIKNRDPSGQIHYGYCYGKTYREAKEKVTVRKAAAGSVQENCRDRKQPFSDFCDAWLASRQSTVKASTYVKYHAILEKYIKPHLGHCPPQQLTSEIAENFQQALLVTEELSAKTVKDILIILRSVLKYTARQFPQGFPVIDILCPKEVHKEMRVLTLSEQARLVEYLLTDMDLCKFGVLLALQTGLRIGEVCALQWEHISLAEGTIRVAATMQRLKDLEHSGGPRTKVVIDAPKSDRSIRTIPMSDSLRRLCRTVENTDPKAYLLTGSRQYLEPRAMQYRLRNYTQACGLADVHFHTLRHTFATRCVEADFDIKSLSDILGHASTTITLDRYVHSSLETKRRNMNKLSGLLP